jgi:hypothetical protein
MRIFLLGTEKYLFVWGQEVVVVDLLTLEEKS